MTGGTDDRKPANDYAAASRENIVYFARALRAAGIPVGPGRGARCARSRDGGRRRHARGFLLDAARGVREAPRAFGAVRPGVPDLLPQARLSRQAARDALAAGAGRRARAAAGRRAARAGGAVLRHERQEAAGGARDRARRAPHRVRPRGAAEEGLRADERGRDRAGQGRDQAAGAAARRGEDAPPCAASPRPHHRHAPHACAPA